MVENRLEGLVNLLADYGGFDKEYLHDKLLASTSGKHSEIKNKMGLVAAMFGKRLNQDFKIKRLKL